MSNRTAWREECLLTRHPGDSISEGRRDKLHSERRRIIMATYVILSNLTDQGRKTLKENPKRILEVNKELEKMGVKVVQQYAVLGPYDFVNIVEAKDNETIMKMSMELGSRGSLQLLTLAAIPAAEMVKKLK
jgi:uncharacterized protein with GYD domain